MRDIAMPALPVVSSTVLAKILEDPELTQNLFPQGTSTSPYEVLEYRATLDIEDPHGMRATFRRTQRIRFLQDGVTALLDHFWGNGVVEANYSNDAGTIERAFSDFGRRHVVLRLRRPMQRGEVLTFNVARTVIAGFTHEHEWLETVVDHPIHQLHRTVLFPIARACQNALLIMEDGLMPIIPRTRADGRTELTFEALEPSSNKPYILVWHW